MRLSDLGGKEIVNLFDGARLGIIGNSDLLIDEASGSIISLIIPKSKARLLLFGNLGHSQVPWECIKRIGPDIVIVDVNDKIKD